MSTPRHYDTSRRRAAAEERRERIVDAAVRLFAERGWTATTIAAVAEEAEVSVELVAGAFGGKPGLLLAAFRHASLEGRSLTSAFDAEELHLEPDPDVRLDRFVEFARATLERLAPLASVLSLAAEQGEELRELVVGVERRHLDTCRHALEALASAPVAEETLDELVLMTRSETYLILVGRRGWTSEQYADWLRRSLRRLLETPAG